MIMFIVYVDFLRFFLFYEVLLYVIFVLIEKRIYWCLWDRSISDWCNLFLVGGFLFGRSLGSIINFVVNAKNDFCVCIVYNLYV